MEDSVATLEANGISPESVSNIGLPDLIKKAESFSLSKPHLRLIEPRDLTPEEGVELADFLRSNAAVLKKGWEEDFTEAVWLTSQLTHFGKIPEVTAFLKEFIPQQMPLAKFHPIEGDQFNTGVDLSDLAAFLICTTGEAEGADQAIDYYLQSLDRSKKHQEHRRFSETDNENLISLISVMELQKMMHNLPIGEMKMLPSVLSYYAFHEKTEVKDWAIRLLCRLGTSDDELDKGLATIVGQEVMKNYGTILSQYNLDLQSLSETWVFSMQPAYFLMAAQKNIRLIPQLEAAHSGICQDLIDEFGIKDFARYPAEVLIRQWEEREDKSRPYVTMITPLLDTDGETYSQTSGAFLGHKDITGEMFRQLQEAGYSLRIAECSSKLEVVHRLNGLRHKYGPMSALVLGGHGTEGSILFGLDPEKGVLEIDDLVGKKAVALGSVFTEDPTVVLLSCSTGAEHGIGERMFDLGAKVIAPSEPASLESINVGKSSDGKLHFDVKFHQKGVEKVFSREGSKLKI